MTTSTKRQRTDEDRKHQILAAARAVFDEKGYESATVSDVVKRAGVAQGTFYLYFESKRDAVLELSRQPMEEISSRMRAAASVGGTFEELLRGALAMAFQFERANMDVCRMITQARQSSKEAFESSDHMRQMREQMVAMFTKAMDDGEMKRMDPELAMTMFHLVLNGAMAEASAGNDEAYSKQIEDTVTEMLVSALVVG